ncbi:hypothetical protein P7K49_018053 [Saguinus oedipus]|uniref:G protein gamma domain-containing protein n=1 Tax=Saguinus oedipus TaxID=9490 RepID=A0ABQ9V701_SAGOE|nr:hypothetical protein P7K49_018053 [Saguinus oedipus]
MASNNTASIAQARKLVEQLKMEANIDRIKIKKGALPCSFATFLFSSFLAAAFFTLLLKKHSDSNRLTLTLTKDKIKETLSLEHKRREHAQNLPRKVLSEKIMRKVTVDEVIREAKLLFGVTMTTAQTRRKNKERRDLNSVSKAAADLMAYCEAHAKEDPLLTPVPASENPFREKKFFCAIL